MKNIIIGLLFLIFIVFVLVISYLFYTNRFYSTVFGCIPRGKSGNTFNNDKCCAGSRVRIEPVGEWIIPNGSFTCE